MKTLTGLLLLVLTGCMNYHYTWRPGHPDPGLFYIEEVDVEEFYTNFPDIRDAEAYAKWRTEIQVSRQEVRRYAHAYLDQQFQMTDDPKAANVIVKIKLLAFEPGSRAGRFFSKGKAGSGRFGVHASIHDATGNHEAGRDFYKGVSDGDWGGSIRGAYKGAGYDINLFVRAHFGY